MAPPKGSKGGKRANSIVALLASKSDAAPTMSTSSKRQKESAATVMDVDTASSTPPTKPPPTSASSTPSTPVHRNTQSTAAATATSTRTALFQPADHKYILYFDLQLQPSKSVSDTCTASHRAALVAAFKALQEVDNTLSLFPYGQTDAPEDLVIKDPDSLGPTIASLTKYCKGFFVRDTYSRMFLQVLLGFDQDPEFILSNAKAVLKSSNAGLYFRPLQTANTKTLGWLFGSHENTDTRFLTKILEDQMKSRTLHPTPLLLGLKYKSIWDGTNKSDQKSPGARAVHIDCVQDEEAIVMPLLKAVLKSPVMLQLSNLPLRLIPLFRKGMPLGEQDGIGSAIAKHRCLQDAMQATTTYDIAALDRPHAELKNATLRSMLLNLRTKDNKVLILSIDRSSWNAGFAITYPAIHSPEATDKIVLLAKYLEHSHGTHVFKWFTADAVSRAEQMGWNDALNRPTTAAELDLQQIVELEIDWCSFAPSGTTSTQRPMVNFDNLSVPSVATATAAPVGHDASPPTSSLADTDDLTTASTIETRMSTVESALSKIMQKLDVLTAPPPAVAAQPVAQGTARTHSTDSSSDTASKADPSAG